jgi:hypothetical protein
MLNEVVKRYTVTAAQCNNVPVALGEFEYGEGSTLSIPVSAIDWSRSDQVLRVETTEGPLIFHLTCAHVPKSLRALVGTVKVKMLKSDAACPSLFRSSDNVEDQ